MDFIARNWYKAADYIKNASAVLVIAISMLVIFIVIFFSISKIKKASPALAVIFSTFVSCILMVPVITSFNSLVDKKITGGILDDARAEIQLQRAEAERLRAENRSRLLEQERLNNQLTISRQSIMIQELNERNMLLERARLSMQSFQQIAELALIQTRLQQTMVRKEPTTPLREGWGLLAEYYNDEVLVIMTHDINAKFGIDLKGVRISKIDDNSVAVSGIVPIFIGADQNERSTLVKEIRRVDYRYGNPYRTRIQDDRRDLILADIKAEQFELEFQRKLSEGLEMDFMTGAIIQLAQNFIKIVLAPLYDNIVFETESRPQAMPLMDYLAQEIRDNNEEKYKLLGNNEQIILLFEQGEATDND
jgi:hypothetical protein